MTRQAFFVLLVKKKKFYSREKRFDQGFFRIRTFVKLPHCCMTMKNISHFLINHLRRNETIVPCVGCQNYIEGD